MTREPPKFSAEFDAICTVAKDRQQELIDNGVSQEAANGYYVGFLEGYKYRERECSNGRSL